MSKPNLGNPNARGVIGNRGDTAPMHLRNIPQGYADRVANQYNAESTYHNAVNDEAFGHLKDLNDHVNRLAESSTSPLAMVAQHSMASAALAHMGKDNASAIEHVRQTHDTLQNMKYDTTVLPELHGFIDRASGHAQEYISKFTPANVTRPANGMASVTLDPAYRSRANVDVSTSKDSPFRGFNNPDALYQKRTYPAEQAKKAKGYVKPGARKVAE